MTDLSRSSNSPLYLAPAIRAPISSEKICLLWRFSGTSPRTIRWASPSAIAVFPVPGSPTRMGLFFVLLESICRTRRISSSRPITGSSLPDLAASLRLIAKRFSELKVASAVWLSTFDPFLNSRMASSIPFLSTPCSFISLLTTSPVSSRASRRCSMETNLSPIFWEREMAF